MEKATEIISEKAYAALSEEIGLLESEQSVFYLSEKWSMYEMIAFLLMQLGPCKVRISSFSISEEAVRMFSLLKENGLLLELTILFDYTTKTHKANLMHFVHNVAANVRTYPNHSKMVLFEGISGRMAVVSSQNLNKNHRVECGAVTRSAVEVEKLSAKFNFFYNEAHEIWN